MEKKNFVKKLGIVCGLCLILISMNADAFAWGRERSHREEVVFGHQRYHYRDGRFYRPGWFGLDLLLTAPPIGAVVSVLPFGSRAIIVAGAPYYYYEGIYYRPYHAGYMVVSEPAPAVVYSAPLAENTVTINVPNSRGSYTAVMLTKRDKGYVGPQGEFYPDHPTVEQLKALYGK